MKVLTSLWVAGVVLVAGMSTSMAADAVAKPQGSERTILASAYDNKYADGIRLSQQRTSGKAFPIMLEYAKYGEKNAQYLLGTYYLAGIGTEANPMEGLIWLGVALEQKIPDWQRRFDTLTAKLTAEQKALLAQKTAERIALYGVEAQHMRCNLEKRDIRSNSLQYKCKKVRDGSNRVTVTEYPELAANAS